MKCIAKLIQQRFGIKMSSTIPTIIDSFTIIGGRVKSWLPVDYQLPVVSGLVVNFGGWKKLSLNFPLKSLTGNLKQMTDSDWSTVFREIKEIKGPCGFLCLRQFSVKRFWFSSQNRLFKVSPSRHGDKSHSNESWMGHSPSAHPRGPLRAWERPPYVGYSIIPIH